MLLPALHTLVIINCGLVLAVLMHIDSAGEALAGTGLIASLIMHFFTVRKICNQHTALHIRIWGQMNSLMLFIWRSTLLGGRNLRKGGLIRGLGVSLSSCDGMLELMFYVMFTKPANCVMIRTLLGALCSV